MRCRNLTGDAFVKWSFSCIAPHVTVDQLPSLTCDILRSSFGTNLIIRNYCKKGDEMTIPNNQGGQPGEQANEILKIFKH